MLKLCSIGCGPHTVALLCRMHDTGVLNHFRATVYDDKPDFDWHPGLMISGAMMQVSFVKDLVTPVNPTSPYSFLNYLSVNGKFDEFVNLSSLCAYRTEFSDYMRWVIGKLASAGVEFRFNQRVSQVDYTALPGHRNGVWNVSGETSGLTADVLQVAIGGHPNIPQAVTNLPTEAVIHSASFMPRFDDIARRTDYSGARVAILGAGQSAYEMLMEVRRRLPAVEVEMICRGPFLKEYTTNKFSNRVYMPSEIGEFRKLSAAARERIVTDYRLTNYAGINAPDLDALYRMIYFDRMEGTPRVSIKNYHEVVSARETREGRIELNAIDRIAETETTSQYSAILLATGYVNNLETTTQRLGMRMNGQALDGQRCNVSDNYLLQVGESTVPMYVLGHNEVTHGIQDTLISNVAHKAAEVVGSLRSRFL